MIDELDWVSSLRPPAQPASSEARNLALQDLQRAIAAETRSVSASPTPVRGRDPAESAVAIPAPGGSGTDRPTRPSLRATRRFAPRQGWLASAASFIVALAIAGAAIVLLGHHSPRPATGGPAGAAAIRGAILDHNGTALVTSRTVSNVQLNTTALPRTGASRAAEYRRLASLLGLSRRLSGCPVEGYRRPLVTAIACDVARQQARGQQLVSIAGDVSSTAIAALTANRRQFPGVSIVHQAASEYPFGALAAQVLGIAGPARTATTAPAPGRGAPRSTIAGRSGLEYQYNQYLQAGDNLRTSLSTQLEQAATHALQHAITSNPPADGGAFVAVSPTNGEVYAMGSLPSFDPKVFTGPISTAGYNALTGPNRSDPLLNRAIASARPTGSTFKPITATAALESGAWSPGQTYDDVGQFCVGTGAARQCRHNSGGAAYGVVDVPKAIHVSDDDFFYNLGALTNVPPSKAPNGGPLDQWAHAYGIGRSTGIDLPGALSGTLPSPRWRESRNTLEAECDSATGPFRYTDGTVTSAHYHKGWKRSAKHAAGGCGIADGTNRPWSIGDNISLAVGQGDVQVTPLQLAVAYAAIANGGTIVRPHLGLEVENQDGTVLQKINPPASRHININPIYLDEIRQGLRAAASQPGGTSAAVFGNFHQQVYGKTGTAQYIDASGVEVDYSWYACFVPATATTRPIVVVVTVQKGGFGAVAAAPVARQILSQWFYETPGPYQAGSSTTL